MIEIWEFKVLDKIRRNKKGIFRILVSIFQKTLFSFSTSLFSETHLLSPLRDHLILIVESSI